MDSDQGSRRHRADRHGRCAPPAMAQQKTEISITRQPGILYMPSHVMEKQKLIEKHAARLGVPGLTVKWVTFSGGGAQTDALLSGSVDMVNTGIGNLLLLWDRTKGGVKGIVATSAQPLTLITRDPKIKSLKDFGAERQDRGADREASRPRRSCCRWRPRRLSAPTSGRSSMPTPCSSAIPMPRRRWPIRSTRCRAISPRRRSQSYRAEERAGRAHRAAVARHHGRPADAGQFFTTHQVRRREPEDRSRRSRAATIEAIRTSSEATRRTAVEIYKEITQRQDQREDLLDGLKEPGMMEWNLAAAGHDEVRRASATRPAR